MGKNKNWTNDESVALCKAYIGVSEDPIVGKDQKADVFWERVRENWLNDSRSGSFNDRQADPLHTQMSKILRTTSKFVAIHQTVTAQNASGSTPDDYIASARSIYKDTMKTEYLFVDCWRILRTMPRFNGLTTRVFPRSRQTAQSPTEESSSPHSPSEPESPSPSRPIGTKRAKAAMSDAHIQASQHAEICRRLDKRNELAELHIMLSLRSEDMDEEMRQVYRVKKAKFIAETLQEAI